jgi:DNA polymerase I-like protein with 3'-5' exonuclease and polymerase domains
MDNINTYREIYEQYENAIRITGLNPKTKRILREPKDLVCFDTETTGLLFYTPSVLHDDNDRIVSHPFPFGISLCFQHEGKLTLVWGRYKSKLYDECKKILALGCMKVAHNLKYDLRICKNSGIEVNGDKVCTLTMSRIFWDRRKSHSLQALCEFICPKLSDWEEPLKKEFTKTKRYWNKRKEEWNPGWNYENIEYVNYSFIPDEIIGKYSLIDVFTAWQLFQKLSPYMAGEYANIFDREMAITHVVTKIEEAGMGFDVKRGRAELKALLPKIKVKRRILDELSPPGFTLGPKKIVEALKFLGVRSGQLKIAGKETTGVDTLNRIIREGVPERAERFIKVLLDFRAYSKIVNTYLKPLTGQAERTGGTIYCSINPTNTRTGRPSCSGPNLLNIPNQDTKQRGRLNHVRDCFVPRNNRALYFFDVSQQEMAMFLSYAGADDMLQAYLDGADLHQHMADLLGRPDKRKIIKNQNFGVIYGLGIKAMAASQNLTIGQAKEEMKIYNREFPFVRELQLRLEDELKMYGYVQDYFGRKYHVPTGQSYKAVNCIVQGGSAQAFKQGLLQVDEIYEKKYPGVKIVLPVYDEIILERKIQKDERQFCIDTIKCMSEIKELMEIGLRFRIDVARTTKSWAEKENLEI